MILNERGYYEAFALSHSFGMQEIKNPESHGDRDMWSGGYTKGTNYTDLQSVNYFSNGRFLNATLWLASFNPKPPTDRIPHFG